MEMKSEQGITVIELLGAIAISTIIIGLISSVFIGSITNYNKTLTHSNLRQEAHLVIVELTEIHHKNSDYQIEIVNELIQVTINGSNQTFTLGNPEYIYSIPSAITITKANDYLNLTLTITDPENNTAPYSTTTIINRR